VTRGKLGVGLKESIVDDGCGAFISVHLLSAMTYYTLDIGNTSGKQV